MDHPNIVKIFEYFEDKKRYYIITELLKGGELHEEILKRKKFSEQDAATVVKQVLLCLQYVN